MLLPLSFRQSSLERKVTIVCITLQPLYCSLLFITDFMKFENFKLIWCSDLDFLLDCFDFDVGKRQAEEEIKKVSAKKQKVEEVIAKQKKEAVVQKVKEESSSEEDSSESEDEVYISLIV